MSNSYRRYMSLCTVMAALGVLTALLGILFSSSFFGYAVGVLLLGINTTFLLTFVRQLRDTYV